MTEREKIIEVIKQASEQAYADFHELFREGVKRVRDGEISCFTNRDVRPTHDEILADKLIEAGFGYIKDLKTELRSKVDYIHEQDDVIKDYKLRAGVAEVFLALIDYQFEKMKHRAETTERALLFLCDKTMSDVSVMIFPSTKTQVRNSQELYDYCIKQADKRGSKK